MAERNSEQDNPTHVITARIFAEMRQSDSMRSTADKQKDMKEATAKRFLDKCRESGVGQAVGRMYESPLAQSLGKISGEIAGEVIEKGWYGRYPVHEATPEKPGAGIHGEQSDLRADFYGRNAQSPEQDKQPEPEPPEIETPEIGD